MIASRTGNALAFALTVLLVATLLISALLLGTGQGAASANSKLAKLQARYLAESAIRLEAWNLSTATPDSSTAAFLSAPKLPFPILSVDSNDFWLHVTSTASSKNQTSTIVADLGKPLNPQVFPYVLRILDSMGVSEKSTISTSDSILLGTSAGKIPSPQILDQILAAPERPANYWLTLLPKLFLADSLEHCTQGCMQGNQHFIETDDLSQTPLVRISNGNLHLDLVRFASLRGTHTLAVQGAVDIDGDLDLDTLTILAEGAVHLKGNISAKRLVIFSKSDISIEGDGRMEVRLYAHGNLRLSGDIEFLPWSFVATWQNADSTFAGRGDIQFTDHTRFSGYAFCTSVSARLPVAPMAGTVGIYIGPDARVYGILAARGAIQNEGFFGGSAIAHKLACAGNPNANCAGHGAFVRDSMPAGLLQIPSVTFGEPPRLAAVRWRAL